MADTKIDPNRFGVSFSLKQCRNFGIESADALEWLLAQGWRRFRLMSYWDEHEKVRGQYDFSELDSQIQAVKVKGGVITLCLGVKQPRWPEYHWPDWALELDNLKRKEALVDYVKTVVERYKAEAAIVSWQLENEALLSNFGRNIQIDRKRLRAEYGCIKRIDPTRPVIMSTSNGWGIPLRPPWPNVVGFSLYTTMYKNGAYHPTIQKPWLYKLRRFLIPQTVFIHELQCEPWGPKAIWEMPSAEQDKSMSSKRIASNIAAAKRIGAYPIDIWGAEWWYWRHLQGDKSIWSAVQATMHRA